MESTQPTGPTQQRNPYRGNKVIVSQNKEFFVYRDALQAILVREPAIAEARGRKNIEKAAGIIAGLLQRYPDLIVEGGMETVTFTGKDKQQYTAPQATWNISSKSQFVRIERKQ